jgi:integrase/recombinase XerD
MSSDRNLYKRQGVYYARVKIDGSDRRRSLRTGSKAVALQKLRKILNEVEHIRHHGEERVTWKNAVTAWAKEMTGVKPTVLDRYKVSLASCRAVLDPLYVDEIDAKTIARLVKHRKAEKVTNATIKRDLTAVGSVISYCCSHGWRHDNPAKAYDRQMIRERRDPIVLPNEADIDEIARRAGGNFGRAIKFAQYTGMRQEEVFGLERPQLRNGTADLWKTKTDAPRAIPLDARALGTLRGTDREDGRWVFWHGKPGDDARRYRNVASRFRHLIREAIKEKAISRAFRFHDLRHWYAVDYLRAGGNIYVLQGLLGHKSIKTTEIYLRYLTPEEQHRAKFGEGAHKGHNGGGFPVPSDAEKV